jgi:hypothetical protein
VNFLARRCARAKFSRSRGPTRAIPQRTYEAAWDSTLADTAIVIAAPLDVDSIATLFDVTRRADGSFWYTPDGRTEGFEGGADSLRTGPWTVVAGQYTSMSYVDDIDVPVDADGRASPEHYRQAWLFAFAPTSNTCAVVVAWRSPKLGSFRGPRYNEFEVAPDSLRAFVNRIQWRTERHGE